MSKVISEKTIRRTNKGSIKFITFSVNNIVSSVYRLFDNRGNFVQDIRTPFRVADYL